MVLDDTKWLMSIINQFILILNDFDDTKILIYILGW